MKIFQIKDGFVFHDLTAVHNNFAVARASYAPNIELVEAPDYVFEGWGFDASKEGDERFIQPQPPEGWLYDEATGTFYPEDGVPPGQERTAQDDTDAMLVDHELRLTLLELGLTEEV